MRCVSPYPSTPSPPLSHIVIKRLTQGFPCYLLSHSACPLPHLQLWVWVALVLDFSTASSFSSTSLFKCPDLPVWITLYHQSIIPKSLNSTPNFVFIFWYMKLLQWKTALSTTWQNRGWVYGELSVVSVQTESLLVPGLCKTPYILTNLILSTVLRCRCDWCLFYQSQEVPHGITSLPDSALSCVVKLLACLGPPSLIHRTHNLSFFNNGNNLLKMLTVFILEI